MVRFSLISLALLASLFSIALAAPMDETSQLLLANPDGEVHTFACPAWKVRCVKDGKWPSGIVGDVSSAAGDGGVELIPFNLSPAQIGKKPFCFSGFRCNQCDFDKNT